MMTLDKKCKSYSKIIILIQYFLFLNRIKSQLISYQSLSDQNEKATTSQKILEYLSCKIQIQNIKIFQTSKNRNKTSKLRTLDSCGGISDCKQCSDTVSGKICVKCDGKRALVTNKKCDECDSGYFFKSNTEPCGRCISNCEKCDDATTCQECKDNFGLDSNKQCRICKLNNGEYYEDGKCKQCPSNCKKCEDSDECEACFDGYILKSDKKKCEICTKNCVVCISTSECTECENNYELNSGQCKVCKINQGQYYDSYQKKCINCLQNCLQCTSASNCQLCNNGYFPNSTGCSLCDNSCLTCNGANSNNCLTCKNQNYFYTETSECKPTCDTTNGYFQNQNKCSPCDKTCTTCNGSSNNQCITCEQDYYKFGSDNLCKECPNPKTSNSVLYCSQQSGFKCLLNQAGVYKVTPTCSICDQGYKLTNNICQDTCSLTDPNYFYDKSTNLCKCSISYPFKHIKKDNTIFCSSSQQPGYYCDTDKVCNPCQQSNCQTCPDKDTCTLCNNGFYLWLNKCQQTCPSSENLQISASKTKCECASNYTFVTPDNICIIQLKITSINLSKDSENNIITLIFNRAPYQNELVGLGIQLDPGKLILNSDYKIVSQKVDGNTATFFISVEQNRRVNEIVVTFNNQKTVFQLQNAILTTNNYNNSQQGTQEKIDTANNASKSLTSGQGNGYKIISVLKQFQILCFLSNFIQFFGPLIVFKSYLPSIVYISTILASSFIFKSIPDPNQLNTTSQSNGTTEDQNPEKQLLKDLGLQENLYYALPIPNISLIICVFIVLFCCFARWVMKGKQYTMEIANFLINIASSVQQGFITPSLFSIYYCLAHTDQKYQAIIQLFIHAAFFLLIYFFSFKRHADYVESYLPNFTLNLNTKARGWNTYLFASYIKKYGVILFILNMPTKPIACGVLLSIIFGCFGLYILYFRFFNSKFINVYKIIQEFLICVTIILFTVCIKKQQDILNSDVISDEDLKGIDKFSLIVIIMLAACLLMSFLLFLVRLLIQIIEIYQKIKSYFSKQIDKDIITESFEEILDQFNSSNQKQIVFKKALIRKESTSLKEKPQKIDLEV